MVLISQTYFYSHGSHLYSALHISISFFTDILWLFIYLTPCLPLPVSLIFDYLKSSIALGKKFRKCISHKYEVIASYVVLGEKSDANLILMPL